MRGDRFSSRRTVLILVLTVVAMTVTVGVTGATERITGSRAELPTNKRVAGDLFAAGRTAIVAGTVAGNVYTAGLDVTVSGHIQGDVAAFGNSIDIPGTITGNLRVAGRDVVITGQIHGDVTAAGGSFSLLAGGLIDGDLIVRGGDVVVRGTIGGSITGAGDQVTISAPVGGNVDVDARELRLGRNTGIAGNLSYSSPSEAIVSAGSIVTGKTTYDARSRFAPGGNALAWLGQPFFRLVSALIAGLIFVIFMPRAAVAVADGTRRVPIAFLLGLVLLIVVPGIVIGLAVTIVGIPAALLLGTVLAAAIYLSQVITGLALGRAILPNSWDVASRGYNILAMTIGVALIGGFLFVPLPYVGLAVGTITALLAVGGIALAGRRPTLA